MRKIITVLLISILMCICSFVPCIADEASKVSFSAQRIDSAILTGEIKEQILKKYVPIRLTVTNRSDQIINLPYRIYYNLENGKEYNVPHSTLLFQRTKKNVVKRGILWGVPSLVFAPIVVPVVISYSIFTNDSLEDNIKRNTYKERHLLSNDSYSAYIFIPKEHRKATTVIIKDISSYSGSNFDIKSEILGAEESEYE